MALSDGYGVVMGTVEEYYRDDIDDFGRYFHGNLVVTTPAGGYRCAIDVDSKSSAIGVEWRTVTLKSSELATLLALGDGYHALSSTSTSGAVDYVRSKMFTSRLGCLAIILGFLGRELRVADTWKRGTSLDALADLEPLVAATQQAGWRVLVFGEPFTSGLGIHNIHQNQGDPAGSTWWDENSIWQDGCTVLQQSSSSYVAFMNKFTSQAYWTDDAGHPA